MKSSPAPLPAAASRARSSIRKPDLKSGSIELGPTSILFARGVLVAASVGQVVFFYASPGAEQRQVNAWLSEMPHIRVDAARFDFIVGQVLTTAGLPLTKEN